MPKISVIIPCYNQEKYIAECLDSVLAQTFDDFETIVINDGSKDNSLDIIKKYASKYPNKIRYIDQQNQGVVAARNNAIEQAKGKYIFPLDGDDKIASDCLEKLYNAMMNNKGDVIYCNVELFGDERGLFNLSAPTKFNMCIQNRVCVSALYKKADWEKYGGYDEIMKKGLEDWEFWLNFIEDNKSFYKVNETLFFYRILNASRNHKIDENINKELIKIMRNKHKKLFGWKFRLKLILSKVVRFFYQKKITKSGKLCIKICNVPLPIACIKTFIKILMNIFYIKNEYRNSNKYKIITIAGFKIKIKYNAEKSIKSLIEDVYPQYHKKHTSIINELREQVKIRKLRVCFLVSETQKWNMQSLYDEMEKSDIFEPFVVVTNLMSMTMRNTQKHNVDFFKKRCSNVEIGFNETTGKSIDLRKFNPDIVFYQQPWDLWDNQKADYVLDFALPYHFSYAIADAPSCLKYHFKSFYLALHKYFIFSQEDENLYDEMYGYKSINTSIVGHPKLDVYKNYKPENYEKKYVIYAPHHSFLPDSILNYGTFDWNGKYILKWAKAHPELNWIFKPHPLLKQILLSSDIMNEAEIEEYYNDWEKLGTYYNDGDYFDLFKSSKCMITDCGSFLTEYLPTQSPVIHLRNPKGTDYVASNKLAMEAYYKAWNLEQLEQLLNDILIEQKDVKKDERLQTIKMLGIEEYNSTEKIIKILTDIFK